MLYDSISLIAIDPRACSPDQTEPLQEKKPRWRLPPSRPCITRWPISRSSSTALARMDMYKWCVSRHFIPHSILGYIISLGDNVLYICLVFFLMLV